MWYEIGTNLNNNIVIFFLRLIVEISEVICVVSPRSSTATWWRHLRRGRRAIRHATFALLAKVIKTTVKTKIVLIY